MNSAILQTKDLAIGYRIRHRGMRNYKKGQKHVARVVAGNLSLKLNEGELVCLLGPNGSGKSTLMRTLAGVQKPIEGEVLLNGSRLERMSPKEVAKKMSLVLTDRAVTGNLSVYALVALGRYPYTGWMGTLSHDDEKIVRQAIETTGIRRFVTRHISDLSDGERQKVMIARALAQDTPVIMLDEPTAHLDLPNRIEVMRLLKRLAREQRKAVVMSTHELDLALQAADGIWLMNFSVSDASGGAADVVTGMPEALVLDGRLEKAFHRNGFAFDRYSGSFRIHHEPTAIIGLFGDGTEAYWTKRALERLGYRVVTDRTVSRRVELSGTNGSKCWRFFDGDTCETEEYTDICAVVERLRKWGHNENG